MIAVIAACERQRQESSQTERPLVRLARAAPRVEVASYGTLHLGPTVPYRATISSHRGK